MGDPSRVMTELQLLQLERERNRTPTLSTMVGNPSGPLAREVEEVS